MWFNVQDDRMYKNENRFDLTVVSAAKTAIAASDATAIAQTSAITTETSTITGTDSTAVAKTSAIASAQTSAVTETSAVASDASAIAAVQLGGSHSDQHEEGEHDERFHFRVMWVWFGWVAWDAVAVDD